MHTSKGGVEAVGGKKDPWFGISALMERLADLIDPPVRDANAMRAEADRLLWECHDCDGVAYGLRREAERIEAAGSAVDRTALLRLAGDMEKYADYLLTFAELQPVAMRKSVRDMAKRIREACGEERGER